MAAPRLRKSLSNLKRRRKAHVEPQRPDKRRQLQLETLEDRRLMAQGPALVAVVPNDEPQLTASPSPNLSFPSAFPTSPRDLTFRFAQGNSIDPTSLATGIIVKSAGPDRIMGDADDQTLTPGFLGLGDTTREVVMRFASTLPDNVYSVTLVGSGLTPLKDTNGNPFTVNGLPANQTINFTLDLGAKIDAVVPQPINRVNNVLQQSSNMIDVYFDQQMSTTDVTRPGFYHLIDATSGTIALPTSVTYSNDATLTLLASGTTTLSYNGVAATLPLTISNQTTRVTINSAGTNNAGTFTLTVNGSTTSPIAASGASAATVQTLLNAIPGLSGNVAVVAGPGGTGIVEQFDITFQGALSGHSATVSLTPIGTGTAGAAATTAVASNIPATGGTGAAASILNNLNSIAALSGKVAVSGPNGGPYTIQFTGALAGTNVLPIVATTTSTTIPPTVLPSIVTITSQPKATLTFANAIAAGTFKLEVGTTAEPLAAETIANAQHVGNSMTTPVQAFIGDSLLPAPFDQKNDVDLYRFDLQNAVTDFAVNVTPAGNTLDAVVRIFNSSGSQVQLINNGAGGAAESATGISLAAGTYYVGVSSVGNIAYNASTGAGATGGMTTGAYKISVTFNDLPATIDDTFVGPNSPGNLDNSSFGTATVLGAIGSAGKTITGANIGPSPNLAQMYGIQLPGAGDAPGERNIPFEQHTETVPGRLPDPTAGVETITYNFQTTYGFTPSGQQFFNSITEPQKQRAREVLELWGRYLGVQFKEVSSDPSRVLTEADIADMTIATGDPRAVAPTISTGTGDAGTGVNGIAGVDSVVSNSDVSGLQTSVTGTVAAATNSTDIVLTSFGHNLQTGDLVQVKGMTGMIAANGAWRITVLDQDHFSLNGSTGNGTYTTGGTWTLLNVSRGVAIMNALVNWGTSQYGGEFFQTAMHETGHLLGLGDNVEAAALTIMGGGETPAQAANVATAEPVFPGDADIVYGDTVHRPESRDIDLYKFTVSDATGGLFRAETVAERLANSSLLNTVLTLYKETTTNGVTTRSVVARNDDYYGNDSYLELHLDAGTYYLAVTSVGNTQFDPTILDSGFGGRTQGTYNLSMSLKPDAGTTSMRDATSVAFDGDGDGNPGGTYQFWFQSNTAANTIYVDKTSTANQNPAQNLNLGTIGSPYNNLSAALAAAGSSTTKKIVRIVGNGGTDGTVSTLADDKAYQVGFKDPNRLQPLADGGQFQVPQNVTVMIDAGAAFKLRRANLNAGTTPQGLVSTSGGAIQVLGTPSTPVVFTSFADDSVGGDSDGPSTGPQGGDYGGIAYRDDSDHERDFLNGANPTSNPLGLVMPVFLNYVNHAMMTYGGGKVTVDSVEDTYDPIYMSVARPTLSYNTIQQSANAGMSANPNTFDDDGLVPQLGFDSRRIGPDIHDNTVINNSINGMFIRVRTEAGSPLDFVDVPTRWKNSDIVHVVSENLEIAGTPGGSSSPGSDRSETTLTDGRLRIDSGVVVKLGGARIETQISSQFIAEGTQAKPIIFTSIKDDHYGAGGTFDTNRDGATSFPAAGDWGGLVFGPASQGSIAQARISYGGGSTPIEGGFDNFNAIEIQQADVRIVNSVLQFNADGGGTTDRNGRGSNADATIFVRGAQPIIANNIVRDNGGPVVSINANAMQATPLADWGQATGVLNAVTGADGNVGPLVRGNRVIANRVNGMEIRGGTLTTETVWDDTDIVHVLFDEIIVPNHQVSSGIRLQSSPTASLTVKLEGPTAGLTASGTPLDIADRIGGTVQIIGQPGFPVVMTSLADDSVGAGFDPDGLPMNDTNNDATNTFLGTLPNFPPATGPLAVTYNTNGTQLANAMLLRPLPQGVTIASATYTGGPNAAGTYINGDSVALGIPPQGVILSSGDANIPATNTSPGFTGVSNTPGDPDLTILANTGRTGPQIPTFDASILTITINVAAGSPIRSGAFSFQFGSDEYPEFVNSFFPDVFGGFINGGAPTNFVHDSKGNLVTINSGFFDQDNTTGKYKIEYDGLTSALTASFPLHAGTNVLKLAIADANDRVVDSGVLMSDLRFSTQDVGPGGTTRAATAGDWRGIKLDQFSNDRNVAEVLETETADVGVNGANDNNNTPQTAQFLGNLAPDLKSGDDTRRLGFQVNGSIATDHPSDVDVYSFNADSGTEAWVDIDQTSYGLDAMVELVDSNGNVIARATDTNPDVTDVHETVHNVTGATNGTPIVIASTSHGLATGDRVFITGVQGNTAANGAFTVTVVDPDHFRLDSSLGSGNYTSGGTWQKITDAGLSGKAGSFDKDPSNGRDTFSTNAGPTLLTASGTITNVTNSFPIVVESANHGLITGDRVLVSGVGGITNANGVFIVTKADDNHFYLNGTIGNGVYVPGTGTWTKLVATTRDPIMRVVLPKAANGTDLKNVPWFIRVRSQPATLEGMNTGNVVNPGLTSGAYQLQVRLQQKDEKPGSTIRFADIRYATNAIEVHGLPYHSPLTGTTAEANDSGNNTSAGAQNIGNLLQVDQNTISVGGQLSSATDVDWYQFDLDFDLLQFVNGYTNGVKTWPTIFDIDYADGLSRPDTTLSVFDNAGHLLLIGRNSNVQDDQSTSTSALTGGSFGKNDAFIGPAQLPAVVPGQIRTYLVAVTSDRMLPQVLDQTFNASATDSNVRLEPVDSIARVISDPLESTFNGAPTGGQTAEYPSNLYQDATVPGQPKSTTIDPTNVQSLKANVKPFTLADVPLFVSAVDPQSGQDRLRNIDATIGQSKATALTDFQTTGPTTASGATDFGTSGQVNALFTARQTGNFGNNILFNFTNADLTLANPGNNGVPSITVTGTTINVVLDNEQDAIANGNATGGTTAAQLRTALLGNNAVTQLVTIQMTTSQVDVSGFTGAVQLSGGANTGGAAPSVIFTARTSGPTGNNIRINFTRQDRAGLGPTVQVVGTQINIVLDTHIPGPGGVQSGTTIQQLINAIASNPAASNLIQVIPVAGSLQTDVANPSDPTAPATFTLQLSGGSASTSSVEVAFGNLLTTDIRDDMADIAFDDTGRLYGYEGVNIPGTTNTAGRLSLIDTGTGTPTTVGNDNIPDQTNPPATTCPASFEEINSNLSTSFGTPGQAALAWTGSVLRPNSKGIYYAVPEPFAGASRLYLADPTNGSAAFVQNQPWGRVGICGVPNPNNFLITAATAATGQTNFASPPPAPATPVTVSFQTIQVGNGAGGVIHFSAQNLGAGKPPTVTINQSTPTVDMDVALNLDSAQAQAIATFSSAQNSVDFTFQAGVNRPGSQGNVLQISFTRANRQGAGPVVTVAGNLVSVTLDTSAGGTTADQLKAAFDALDNNPNTTGIISANFTGLGGTVVSNTAITNLQLSGGADPTTAQQLVTAINSAFAPLIGQVVQASLSGNPNTVIALPKPSYPDVTLTGASGAVGFTTGLAFATTGQLFGVTDQGQFLRNISVGSAAPQQAIAIQLPDPSNPGNVLSGANLRFEALTRGPQNVEDGRYANMFFAITDTGILTALNYNGVPQQIFDVDGDGTPDSVDIQTGLPSGVTGLAFSPFDFNLWHPTYQRQNDPGHDIGPSPTATTRDTTSAFPASGRTQDINESFYFGFEQFNNQPGVTTDSYQTYLGPLPFLGTGNANLPDNTGQLGELLGNDNRGLGSQRELSTNAQFNDTYDTPGGAYGSLITDKFSLATMSASDKPTFYFDYFLDTEDTNTGYPQTLMRDSARVYIGPFTRTDSFGNTYTTWDLVATNNSTTDSPNSVPVREGELPTFQSASVTAMPANPRQQVQLMHDNTGEWRQARVDLSRYSGLTNLQLRFDFTTAGQMPDKNGHLPTVSQPGIFPPTFVSSQPGQDYLFEDGFGNLKSNTRGTNNNHEGFYVDNIIVGAAERGEMVINAPVNTTFTDLYAPGTSTQPKNFDPNNPFPTQVLAGPYQLEIRRGTDYGISDGGPLNGLNAHNSQTPILLLDTNDRLIPDERTSAPIPKEDFETGTFGKLPWSFTDDAPWTITNSLQNPNGGTFSAASGTIGDGQSSGLSIDLITGSGNLTFSMAVDSEPGAVFGDFLRLYVDGRLAQYTAVDGVMLPTPLDTEWSGNVPFQTVTVPLSAGHHSFRWTYDKDFAISVGQDKAFLDDIQFPAPQVGVQNIYEDLSLNNPIDPNSVTPPIGPTLPTPSTRPAIRFIDTLFPGFSRVGDTNADRPQGHVQIEQNQIFAASQIGILIDDAQRDPVTGNPYPGSVRNLPTLNNDRLVPGVTVSNNVVIASGQVGIQYNGDPDPANQPVAAVPFGRIVNNTVYGGTVPGGTGILVKNNAGPTLLNNIVANLNTGISVDSTSTATTVLGANLYANNAVNTPTGTTLGSNPIVLAATDPLFLDPAHNNFYLAFGSQAIDSSLNSLADRPSIAAVKSAIGIPQSPILAPDRDLFGQLRVDDPNQSPPPGLGQNIFKDRGAVERADFLHPTASVFDPLDNDLNHRDRNPAVDDVAIRNENLTQFIIQLSDSGIGIDDNTVSSAQFTLTSDGVPLVDTVDYQFVYNAATDQAIFRPTAGVWPLNHTYKITINNNKPGSLDTLGNPLPTGILDLAGNEIAANRPNNETSYNIFVGTLYDFGDAPDPKYPTLLASNGAAHVVQDGFHLGATITEESEALQSPTATGDTGDDGVQIVNLSPGTGSKILVSAAIPTGMTGILDAWIDLNQDGDWNDPGEKVIDHFALADGSNTINFTFGSSSTPRGATFARFRLSSAGTNSPTGVAPDGEVEDYKVNVTGPPYQNPNNPLDVNNSGQVSPIDALIVINFINALRPQTTGQIPLPPTSPPFASPAPVIDPAGSGPGKAQYIDVDGDTFLSPHDALLVINYLNAQVTSSSGEGEGESPVAVTASSAISPLLTTSAATSSVADSTIIPPVLVASPGIELEVRSSAPQATLLASQPALDAASSQDLALLAVSAASSISDSLSLVLEAESKLPIGPLDESSWEELLGNLASDQRKPR